MMIKDPPSRTVLVFGLCVVLSSLIASVAPRSSYAVTPTPPLAHPIPAVAPLPLTEEPTPSRRNPGGPDAENIPPLSLAFDDADGVLYSRDVNRIYEAAHRIDARGGGRRSNSQTRNETWLATAFGVKCIDRAAGVVRHYGRAEGLPGPDVIAICADTDDVWCLVQDRTPLTSGVQPAAHLHLCSFDASSGQWSDRRQFLLDSPRDLFANQNPITGKSSLSINKRYVAVVLSRVYCAGSPLVTLLDRRNGTFREIPCEPGLRADVLSVDPDVLRLDDDGIWVGTDHGLLRWHFRTEVWTRMLPDRVIHCGATNSRQNDNAIWVAHSLRAPDQSFGARRTPDAGWQLSRVSADEGKVATWPAPSISVASPYATDPSFSGAYPWGDAAVDLQKVRPVGLSVAGDGTVWTSHAGIDPQQGSRRGTFGSGWLRFDPTSAAWQAFVVHGSRPAGFGPPQNAAFEIRSSAGEKGAATPFAEIPSDAVLPLALVSNRYQPYVYSYNPGEADPEVFWLRRRFPQWLCPDAPGAGTDAIASPPAPVEALPVPPQWTYGLATFGPFPDVTDPGLIWLVGSAADSVVHAAPADISPELMKMRLSGNYSYTQRGAKMDLVGGRGSEFFLTNGKNGVSPNSDVPGVKADPPIIGLVSLAAQATARDGGSETANNFDLVAGTTETLYGIRSGSEALVPLQTIGREPFNTGRSLGLVADASSGGSSLLYLENNYNKHDIVSWDPHRGAFTTLPNTTIVDGARGVLSVNPADGGLWLRVNGASGRGETAVYIPGSLRKGEAASGVRIEVSGPSDKPGSWRLWGATGSVAWWGTNSGSGPGEVRGYDGVRQRWIAAAPDRVAEAQAMGFARVDDHGDLYIVCESLTGTALWRYDAEADRWIAIAPAPSLPTSVTSTSSPYNTVLTAQLIHVSKDAIFLAGYKSQIYRYDRKAAQWDAPISLPQRLQNPNQLLDRSLALAGDALYAGGRDGLYRLTLEGGVDGRLPASAMWKSLRANLLASDISPSSGLSALRFSAIVPEPTSVFGLVAANSLQANFGARLDPATGHWRLYDDEKGFPCRDLSLKLFGADGDVAWLSGASGVYRYDRRADEWQRLLATPAQDDLGQYASDAPAAHPPFGLVSANATVVTNGAETDVLAQPPYKLNARPEELAAVIWRFANADGRLLGKLTAPSAAQGYYRATLAVGDGSLWVGLDGQLYLVRPDAAAAAWHAITLPPDVIHGPIQRITADPHGGLWIVSASDAWFWKTPHD